MTRAISCKKAGQRGGLKTLEKHGVDHYRRMGAKSRKKKEA